MSEQWDTTFSSLGFCLLTGHASTLPDALIEELRAQALAFFEAPQEEKAKAASDGIYGYVGPGKENVGATFGQPTSAPDLVESVSFPGYQEEGIHWAGAECPWAEAPWLGGLPPGLLEAARAYWAAVTKLMRDLVRLTGAALDLPEGVLDAAFEQPGARMGVSAMSAPVVCWGPHAPLRGASPGRRIYRQTPALVDLRGGCSPESGPIAAPWARGRRGVLLQRGSAPGGRRHG